jgi:hypothetical protein
VAADHGSQLAPIPVIRFNALKDRNHYCRLTSPSELTEWVGRHKTETYRGKTAMPFARLASPSIRPGAYVSSIYPWCNLNKKDQKYRVRLVGALCPDRERRVPGTFFQRSPKSCPGYASRSQKEIGHYVLERSTTDRYASQSLRHSTSIRAT